MIKTNHKDIKNLLQQALKERCFEQRSNTGKLSQVWEELFGDSFGTLTRRDGDTLYVNVKGAPLKAELENFKKWELLETLHTVPEFASINDIHFTEK